MRWRSAFGRRRKSSSGGDRLAESGSTQEQLPVLVREATHGFDPKLGESNGDEIESSGSGSSMNSDSDSEMELATGGMGTATANGARCCEDGDASSLSRTQVPSAVARLPPTHPTTSTILEGRYDHSGASLLKFDNHVFDSRPQLSCQSGAPLSDHTLVDGDTYAHGAPRTLTLGGLVHPSSFQKFYHSINPNDWKSTNMECPYGGLLSIEDLAGLRDGKGSVWYSLPEGIFSEMLLKLQVDEVRNVRLMCREWRWTTRRALTSLRPRKLPTTRILHAFPFLKSLDLDRCSRQLRDGDLEQVQRLSSLTELNLLSCDNITDMGILALLPLTSLGSLCLQRCTLLTDRALASLIHLPNLHTLNIGQVAGISDDGIGLLARGMPRLRNLSLQACSNITDAGLKAVSEMPSLTALTMSRCSGITDEGLAALQPLAPTLQQLELGMCSKLTHEGLAGLHKLSNITKLNLSACKVTDMGVSYLRLLPRLSTLDLSTNAQITGHGLAALASPTLAASLTSLDLSLCMDLSKGGLTGLTAFSSLTQLNLHRCEVGDNVLSLIGNNLGCVRELDLSNCSQFGDEGLQMLARLPALTRLNLQQCNGLSSLGLRALQSLSTLTWLNVSQVNQADDAAMEGFRHLTRLQTLDMTWCARVSSTGAKHLAQLRQLSWLSLAHCYQVADETCQALAELTQLTHLDLSMCHQIGDQGLGCLDTLGQLRLCKLMGLWTLTDAGLSRFIRNVPSTTFLDVRKCERISPQVLSKEFRDKRSSLRYILSDRQ